MCYRSSRCMDWKETYNTESTGGPKADARAEISLAPKLPWRPRSVIRGGRAHRGRPIPVDSPFRRNFMSGALTVVPGVHLSDFCARAKCLFEEGKGEGRSAGAHWRYVFRSGRFQLFCCCCRSLSLSSFIAAEKKVFGSLVNFSRHRPLCKLINV